MSALRRWGIGEIKQIGFHVTTTCNNVFYLFSVVRKCIGLHEVVIIIKKLVHYNELYNLNESLRKDAAVFVRYYIKYFNQRHPLISQGMHNYRSRAELKQA